MKRTLNPIEEGGERCGNELGLGRDWKLRLRKLSLAALFPWCCFWTEPLTNDSRGYKSRPLPPPHSSFNLRSRAGKTLLSQAVQLDLSWGVVPSIILWMNLLVYRPLSLAPFSSGEKKAAFLSSKSFTPTSAILEVTVLIFPHTSYSPFHSLSSWFTCTCCQCTANCNTWGRRHGTGPRGTILDLGMT